MKAVQFHRYGEPADVLRVAELPAPEAGPGELLVRLTARPVNPSDLEFVRGLEGIRPELPAVPGFEGVGVVEAIGPGAGDWQVGQRIVPLLPTGTWQELMTVEATRCLPVPQDVDDRTAAQFVVNPLSAWAMVTESPGVEPGQWLLQTAAGSALGRVVVQLGKARGFRTINVVRRREQAGELTRLGGDAVVCTDDEDLGDRVRAITGGRGVPLALDAVGGRLGTGVVEALAPGGTLVAYSLMSGEPTPVDYAALLYRSLTVRGFWLRPWLDSTPRDRVKAGAGELMGLFASGAIRLGVGAEYPLDDVSAAVRQAERSGGGKVLLVG